MSELITSSRPTISVVIATYNRSSMVREAVLAAWNQTLQPDEIVVSDDCSTDDTVEVLRQLQREVPVLKIVESNRNSGGVPNWNQVIEASSGDIVAWCSDDDRFKNNHLENALDYLDRNADVGMVHAGFEEVFDRGVHDRQHQVIPLKSQFPIVVTRLNTVEYFSTQYLSWPFHPSTLVFRRKLWDCVGPFDPRYALADTEWFIRATIDNKIAYLPYHGVINRRHFGAGGNWSSRVGSIAMQREHFSAIKNFINTVKASSSNITDLDRQYSKWMRQYRILLVRIFVSRARAGAFSVVSECAAELLNVTPSLKKIPQPFRLTFVYSTYYLLYRLQAFLPGGRGKYRDLGKFIPL